MSEVLETRGDYRVTLTNDEWADGPDGDGQGSTYSMSTRRPSLFALVHKGAGPTGFGPGSPFHLAEVMRNAWDRFQDIDTLERYLRMFHGVVGFDSFDTQDEKYVNVVTREDLTEWGFSSLEDYRARADWDDPSHGNLTEWRAYAEGDVWSYAVERREHWTSDTGKTHDTWETVDSCGGFYGRQYAEEAALEALGAYAEVVSA